LEILQDSMQIIQN